MHSKKSVDGSTAPRAPGNPAAPHAAFSKRCRALAGIVLCLSLPVGCGGDGAPKQDGAKKSSGPAFSVAPEELVQDLSVATPGSCVWAPFFPEGLVYTDRAYTYGDVPADRVGNPVLRTANDDKLFSATKTQISFNAKRRIRVAVLYSSYRAALVDRWLNDGNGWQPAQWRVNTTLDLEKAVRNVRHKVFEAGQRIELGGTGCRDNDCDSYTVLVMPQE